MLIELGLPTLSAFAERIKRLLHHFLDFAEVSLLVGQLNRLLNLVVSQNKLWIYSGIHRLEAGSVEVFGSLLGVNLLLLAGNQESVVLNDPITPDLSVCFLQFRLLEVPDLLARLSGPDLLVDFLAEVNLASDSMRVNTVHLEHVRVHLQNGFDALDLNLGVDSVELLLLVEGKWSRDLD